MARKKDRYLTIIILIVSIFIVFMLVGTLFVDFIFISANKAPLFSNIFSVKYNDDEVIIGRGVLYKTQSWRIDISNGYLAAYKLYLPWNEGYSDLEENFPSLELEYYAQSESLQKDKIGNIDNTYNTDDIYEIDDVEIIDDNTLNMDAIKRLAYMEIDPFEFMNEYPAVISLKDSMLNMDITEEDEIYVYYLRLPNEYALSIEYTGDEVIEMLLIDEKLEQYINIQTQLIEVFLMERDEN